MYNKIKITKRNNICIRKHKGKWKEAGRKEKTTKEMTDKLRRNDEQNDSNVCACADAYGYRL
jgi:hypothetical protein